MRFYLVLYLAKATQYVISLLGIGAGYTWPGHIALRLYPDVLKDPKIYFKKGVVIISGTNGKTTTSKLITHLLTNMGHQVVHNSTGANLLNGIVSEVLLSFKLSGKTEFEYGVFEVDEFTLPTVLSHIKPSVLVLLNLSRDQLDRYGETDIIFQRWFEAVVPLQNTALVLDQETSLFNMFLDINSNCYFFGAGDTYSSKTHLRGKFNVKNLNASLVALSILGFTSPNLLEHLNTFSFAYGRGESVGKFHIYLAKNPASFNQNLEILSDFEKESTGILLVLNDNIPDGRDVSWIYDIDTRLLYKSLKSFEKIYIAGTRSYDMAVRLQYADLDIDQDNIFSSLSSAVLKINSESSVRNAVAFPNYSAMLDLRKLLTGKAIL